MSCGGTQAAGTVGARHCPEDTIPRRWRMYRVQRLGRPIWERNRLELVGVEQTAIILDYIVNYEHKELAQSRGRGG